MTSLKGRISIKDLSLKRIGSSLDLRKDSFDGMKTAISPGTVHFMGESPGLKNSSKGGLNKLKTLAMKDTI